MSLVSLAAIIRIGSKPLDLGLLQIVSSFSLILILGLGLQMVLSGLLLQRLLSTLFRNFASIYFRGGGFLLPFLYFSARDFCFLLYGSEQKDRFFFQAEHIRFWINPLFLLMGRLQISRLHLTSPLLHYFSRQEPHKKKQMLPAPGRMQIKNINIRTGFIYIYDESMRTEYRICLSDVQTHKMAVDLSTPVYMFFQMRRGQARIGEGKLTVESSARKGVLQLWGLKWNEIFSLQGLSLPIENLEGAYLGLIARFRWIHRDLHIEGIAGSTSKQMAEKENLSEERINGVKFAFTTKPQECQTTLDLGIQKLIEKILESAQTTWLSKGLVWGSKRIFHWIKKPDA